MIEVVMSLFSVLLTIFTYTIQDINMIIYYDIAVINMYSGNKNNEITAHFFGSACLESVNNHLKQTLYRLQVLQSQPYCQS